jgi:hypothetical protein
VIRIMADQNWYKAVEMISPHVVRILTPRGSGTGFLFHRSASGNLIGIATAAHVVEDSHAWEEPMRIYHAETNTSILVREAERAVFLDTKRDTAAIIFGPGKRLQLPLDPFHLAPEGKHLKQGNEIAWLGFPAVARDNLCFFNGHISASVLGGYLVDGVAINGVSGGPAFHLVADIPILFGVLAAYMPNRATGEALPGLAVIQDVSHFHELVKGFKSVDQAKEQETSPEEVALVDTNSQKTHIDKVSYDVDTTCVQP